MPYIAVDRVGRRYGRLTVVKRLANRWERTQWGCICDCGNANSVMAEQLEKGATKSCGCLRREVTGASRRTHGMSLVDGKTTPEYQSWRGMIQRCENKNNKRFDDYGGRGITVCERWRRSFSAFFADMGARPTPRHSIDRFPDNDGNYEPTNCRWATPKEQRANCRPKRPPKNRKGAIYVALDGQRLTLKDACLRVGASYGGARRRFRENGRLDVYAAMGVSHG